MAAATKHLGIATTVSAASLHPFLAVRSLSSLDFLSQGRVGWNIVTGNAPREHRAMGIDVSSMMNVTIELMNTWRFVTRYGMALTRKP